MAQTFHANSGTRLHPVEWTTGRIGPVKKIRKVTILLFLSCCFAVGLAAGLASTFMTREGISTEYLYNNRITQLQKVVGAVSPLVWTLPSKT